MGVNIQVAGPQDPGDHDNGRTDVYACHRAHHRFDEGHGKTPDRNRGKAATTHRRLPITEIGRSCGASRAETTGQEKEGGARLRCASHMAAGSGCMGSVRSGTPRTVPSAETTTPGA